MPGRGVFFLPDLITRFINNRKQIKVELISRRSLQKVAIITPLYRPLSRLAQAFAHRLKHEIKRIQGWYSH